MKCEDCNFYQHVKTAEHGGKIGQCRYYPPVYSEGTHSWNRWPQVTAGSWCGKFAKRS